MKAFILLVALALPFNVGAALILDEPRPVNIDWSDVNTKEDGFIIQRNLNGGIYSELTRSTVPDVTRYVDSSLVQSLTSDNIYCYRILAYSRAGTLKAEVTSLPSSVDCVTVKKPQPLSAPTGLTVSAIDSSTLDVSWAVNEIVLNTELARRSGRTPNVEQYIILAGDATSFRDEGLGSRQTKCYFARHVAASRNASPWSDPSCGTTR